MNFQNMNLELKERVAFHSTGSDLDGKTGYNLGLGVEPHHPFPDHYIIMLDEPLEDQLAVLITEACLSRIN